MSSLQKHYILPESTFNEWVNEEAAKKRLSLLEKQMLRVLYSKTLKPHTKWLLYQDLGYRHGFLSKTLKGYQISKPNVNETMDLIESSTPIRHPDSSPPLQPSPITQQNSVDHETSRISDEDVFDMAEQTGFNLHLPETAIHRTPDPNTNESSLAMEMATVIRNPRDILRKNLENEYNVTPRSRGERVQHPKLIIYFEEDADGYLHEKSIMVKPNLTRINDSNTVLVNVDDEEITIPTSNVAADKLQQLAELPNVDRRTHNRNDEEIVEASSSRPKFRYQPRTEQHQSGEYYYIFDTETNKKTKIGDDYIQEFLKYMKDREIPMDDNFEAFDLFVKSKKEGENSGRSRPSERNTHNETPSRQRSKSKRNRSTSASRSNRNRSTGRNNRPSSPASLEPNQQQIDKMPNIHVVKHIPSTSQLGKGKTIKWQTLYD